MSLEYFFKNFINKEKWQQLSGIKVMDQIILIRSLDLRKLEVNGEDGCLNRYVDISSFVTCMLG